MIEVVFSEVKIEYNEAGIPGKMIDTGYQSEMFFEYLPKEGDKIVSHDGKIYAVRNVVHIAKSGEKDAQTMILGSQLN